MAYVGVLLEAASEFPGELLVQEELALVVLDVQVLQNAALAALLGCGESTQRGALQLRIEENERARQCKKRTFRS